MTNPIPIAALLLLGCNAAVSGVDDPRPPLDPLPDADVSVLFVGNSLTASNDLPRMVEQIAEAAGRTFAYRSVLRGGTSLEDHWNLGIAQDILAAQADFVVMQQGPSSVGDNPAYLRTWTETLAPVIRQASGEPALLMVWPERTRLEAFDAVRDSYEGAADAVSGVFIPAGEAWRAIWARDADAPLYGPDGFHPSALGSFAAAVSVFAVLFEEDPRDLPGELLGFDRADLVYEAVWATVQ